MLHLGPTGLSTAAIGPLVGAILRWPPVYHPVFMARDPHNTHLMVTRCAAKITKYVDRLQLSVAASLTLSLISTSVRRALVDPH
jgi:hypothetical protein